MLHALSPPGFAAFPLFDELSGGLVLAHVFFLQDILAYPSLSAGIWYLGIDYQFCLLFFALMLLHGGLIRALRIRSRRLDTALLLALFVPGAVMSIFVWNLNYDDEPWVHCYACSLFVGVVCAWALIGRVPRWVFWAYAGVVAAGLIFDWRRRLALALATGILIYFAGRGGRAIDREVRPWLRSLGRISYSLFLVHYPTNWVVASLRCPSLGRLRTRSPDVDGPFVRRQPGRGSRDVPPGGAAEPDPGGTPALKAPLTCPTPDIRQALTRTRIKWAFWESRESWLAHDPGWCSSIPPRRLGTSATPHPSAVIPNRLDLLLFVGWVSGATHHNPVGCAALTHPT